MKMTMVLCALLLAGAPVNAQDVATHYRNAIKAYQSDNRPLMLSEAQAALALRPRSASLTYLVAAGLAWNGRADEAVTGLETLAGWGLTFQADKEPAFSSLSEDARFHSLTERFQANAQPMGEATVFRGFDDGHFIPEGIAYDPQSDRLYLGSIHQQRIVYLGGDGKVTELVGPNADGLLSAFGMRLLGDHLLVATSGMPEGGADEASIGRAGVLVFSKEDGQAKAAHWLPDDGNKHVLGDLVVLGSRVYASDSLSGELWQLDLESGAWSVRIEAGRLVSPQGLVLDASGRWLYLADYRRGLLRVATDRDTPAQAVPVPEAVTLEGIDGLYRHGRDLIAIQNGIRPHRVVRIRLNEDGSRVLSVTPLISNLASFDEPTLGTVVGDRLLLVANSHWPRFDGQGKLPPEDELDGPKILSLTLLPQE
jgi:sugar lactone lactonase YvrE